MLRSFLPLALLLVACSTGATKDPTADDATPDAADPADDAGDGAEDTDEGDADEGEGADDGDGAEDPGAGDTGSGGDAPTSPDGAELYASNCAGCHAPDGGGTGSGPDITGDVQDMDDAEIIHVIQSGKEDMPAFDMTDEEAQSIVDWMRSGF